MPESEHHELGLLFISYLLRSRGVKVLYLGSNVPVSDVEFVIRIKKPDFAYTHLTSLGHNFNFEKFLNQLASKIKTTPIVISGLVTQQYRKNPPQGINFKKSLPEVMAYISEL